MKDRFHKKEPYIMFWHDPSSLQKFSAGTALFNESYCEFELKIDEEAYEKNYYLRKVDSLDDQCLYSVELDITDDRGNFVRREVVGEGFKNSQTCGDIFIRYGSKYKYLVINIDRKGIKKYELKSKTKISKSDSSSSIRANCA